MDTAHCAERVGQGKVGGIQGFGIEMSELE